MPTTLNQLIRHGVVTWELKTKERLLGFLRLTQQLWEPLLWFFLLILLKGTLSLGYLWMDELHDAVAPFLPSSGGTSGAFGPQPGPSGGEGSVFPLFGDQELPGASHRDFRQPLPERQQPMHSEGWIDGDDITREPAQSDFPRETSFQKERRLKNQLHEIASDLYNRGGMEQLLKKGYNVKNDDIGPVVDLEFRCKQYSNSIKGLETLLKSLQSKKVKSPFWKLIEKELIHRALNRTRNSNKNELRVNLIPFLGYVGSLEVYSKFSGESFSWYWIKELRH
uniref:Uncharacterized protein n=1 Tax=Mirabilis himalaica TaxID=482968 RepID=A0A6M9TTH4_9CARY|nr:hypothetical protein [Mirabilis himalaica]QKN19355.1 hypothetical protein [Mirabilis himalaica]